MNENNTLYTVFDLHTPMGFILLAAVHLGLGACWVAWFTQEEVRPVLGIPADKYVVGIITVGYANESPKDRPRRELKEITHYGNW